MRISIHTVYLLFGIVFVLLTVLFIIKLYYNKVYEGFLDKQERIVVSLTTSPKRIETIETTLQSLTNQLRKPDVIYLNLPERFGRTNEPYTIPSFLSNYPLVNIHRVEKDDGPITKLTPALKLERDPNTILIIVDDDTNYDEGMIQRVVGEMNKSEKPHTVVAQNCRNDFHKEKKAPYCEIPEGWSGVAFRRGMFQDDFQEYISTALLNEKCVRSDDLLIGNYLEKHGIPKLSLGIRPQEMWFCKQGDALSIIDVEDDDRYTPCRNYLKSKNIYHM